MFDPITTDKAAARAAATELQASAWYEIRRELVRLAFDRVAHVAPTVAELTLLRDALTEYLATQVLLESASDV